MNKIITKLFTRKINDLNAFQSFISYVLTLFSIGAIATVLIVFAFIYWAYAKQEKNSAIDLISSANSILASNISEQLSIITNTPDFVNYLRSGDVSRKQNYADMQWLFSGLDQQLITGVYITQNDEFSLFSYGEKNDTYITLSLCYLNARLNSQLGQCNYHMIIYFNGNNYLKNLNKINSHITSCNSNSCINYNSLALQEFGNFSVINPGNLTLQLEYAQQQSDALFLALCVFIIFIFTLLILSQYIIKRLVKKYLINPVKTIQENLGNKNPNSHGDYSLDEFHCLSNAIKSYQEQEIGVERNKKAAQVAHDIRSPLTALQILTEEKLTEVEESKRILLRDAVYQIRDIVNNLDQNISKNQTLTPIAILLEAVLSERRTAFSNKNVNFETKIDNDAYCFFIDVIPSEIKRVITNIINNAVEALPSVNGNVEIALYRRDNTICISIQDNGCGIAEDMLAKLFIRGTTTKKTGSGLGLFHAKETIEQWGGTVLLTSTLNVGTTIVIKLPAQTPPQWFTPVLSFLIDSVVICVDDSISIWNVWQERFKLIVNHITLRFCNDKMGLLQELSKKEPLPCTYLVDYEFSGQSYTGLDLIKLILDYKKENDHVFLVTSRSSEEIQEFCIEHNILMISKLYALKIPVNIKK